MYKPKMITLNITLTPYVYDKDFSGILQLRIIEEGQESPDPNKWLLWGRDETGEMQPGDWKRQYRKIGKPVHLKIKMEDTFHYAKMKKKSEAIKKFIRKHKWPKVK